MKHQEHHTKAETEERLRKMLRGALDGPPTPLKEMPTRSGQPRKRSKNGASSRATAKSERP